ncbi:hypothetical protein RN001_004724 [Aquatica leii]|uniref:Peptidase M12B domain-containing protein n=1 Tax=Aquatica leii TaxID=1421715 RepID=A0AAN7Q627_9COLE|nr:hypothetical protein RN001_004724 [Aquatica leii]
MMKEDENHCEDILFNVSEVAAAVTDDLLLDRFNQQATQYELVVPHKATEKGEFKSHIIPHHYNRNYYKNKRLQKMSADDMIYYIVPIFGDNYHLELVPNNDMISPGMVIETHNGGKISNSKIRRLGNVQCHYKGSVRGQHDSRVALSTCSGLSGFLKTKRGEFIIEPMEGYNQSSGKEHPHFVYPHDKQPLSKDIICNMNNIISRTARNQFKNVRPTNVTEYHIEVLLTVDKSMLNHHARFDVDNYILTVFNMAHALYQDSSLGLSINLAIVRIIRLEEDNHKLNLAVNKNVKKTLESFEKWQHTINPRDDTHPNHHDVAILLTRRDICGDDDNCGILGASVMGGICDPEHQAAVCVDRGLRLGFIIAHEIGHTLAIPHDESKEADCKATLPNGTSTVMNPSVNIQTSQWSPCSVRFLKLFIEQGYADCLLDLPIDHGFQMPDILPGVMYGADFQCRELLTPTATLCDVGVECDNLLCFVKGKGCIETYTMAASGTNCGEKKWCFRGECVEEGERPGAIDPRWSRWSNWSDCSRTCGSGVQVRERYCTNPAPGNGGKYCSGTHKEHQICIIKPCESGSLSFRNAQCAKFNQWIYPEDNKIHQWKAYRVKNENPCVLFCVNDEGDVASLRPRVEDGTKCVKEKPDICVGGTCRVVPCDFILESTAIEDWCGVCRGNGTSCVVQSGLKHFQRKTDQKQIAKLVEIPKYSINIKVEETEPTESKIQVVEKLSNETVIEGNVLGQFNVTGVTAWLGNIRTKQEALNIPGNITNDIIIQIVILDNTTIKYSYGTPNITPRKPVFNWDYLDWTKCSSACGSGTEEAIPRCTEKTAGLVDDMYCAAIIKPNVRVRPCEIAPCVARWMVGDWQECSPCPNGRHYRSVRCVIPTGDGETKINLVHEYQCVPPKPKDKENCVCSSKNKKRIKQKLLKKGYLTSKSATSCNANEDDNLDAKRLTIIIDKEDPKNVKLTIHNDSVPNQLTNTDLNSTKSSELVGKAALKFINKLNRNFAFNKRNRYKRKQIKYICT